MQNITLDNVLNSSFGEASSEMSASFKKTVLVRQYETEVVEYSTVLKIEKPISGAERVLISAMLQIQLEYSAYVDLVYKGYVTENEFNQRKTALTEEINNLTRKAESILNKPLDKYFGLEI